jgi:hypothetical protein
MRSRSIRAARTKEAERERKLSVLADLFEKSARG